MGGDVASLGYGLYGIEAFLRQLQQSLWVMCDVGSELGQAGDSSTDVGTSRLEGNVGQVGLYLGLSRK